MHTRLYVRDWGNNMEYEKMTDEQLIERLRAGEKPIMDFLMEKYKGLVRQKAKAMYLWGGENDDLIQEGMIGLFKAIRDYDLEKGTDFLLYSPETPTEGLDEEFLTWWPNRNLEDINTLNCWGLWNQEMGYGFFTY